ncbi:peptidase U32 family protein [Lactococcus termiticola]|nr:peptidase U32 family protein [Lactococcus termiticola]
MIKLIATAESVEQAKGLLDAGVDSLYIGDERFALRLAEPLSKEEITEITRLAHEAGKEVIVGLNAIMHVEKMKDLRSYLDFLQELGVDQITVGDAGVIQVLQTEGYQLPFIYDASTMVVSARQVNFWARQGAEGAVLARELPKPELEAMAEELVVPGEILVYGASVIHHSLRPLLQNYYNFIQTDEKKDRASGHFLSEPKDKETHYSIFEDEHGTHIYATDDLDMMNELTDLKAMGYEHWKLDGIFTRGEAFVEIAKIFNEARKLVEAGELTADKAFMLDEQVRKLHPVGRTLGTGFYNVDPDTIK